MAVSLWSLKLTAGRNQKSEIRNQKSEIRNQKSEIRNQKSEIRGMVAGYASGCTQPCQSRQMPGPRCIVQEGLAREGGVGRSPASRGQRGSRTRDARLPARFACRASSHNRSGGDPPCASGPRPRRRRQPPPPHPADSGGADAGTRASRRVPLAGQARTTAPVATRPVRAGLAREGGISRRPRITRSLGAAEDGTRASRRVSLAGQARTRGPTSARRPLTSAL